ncbi:hypothetical protein TNCV_4039071 [Trichonephila clavipes]|nr:hypothetical protein TNCV_4039071 [Trichonephila clavipes]
MVVENQHLFPPEEPELMTNTDSDAPKIPVSFFISNNCLKQHNIRKKEKEKKMNWSILTSAPIKEMLEQREKQKEEQITLRKQRREAREAKKGVKKLKLKVPVDLSL